MRQIVAIGGMGFSPALVRYLLGLVPSSRPVVAFLGTATGDTPAVITSFYESYPSRVCARHHVTLFGIPTVDFRAKLLASDIIFVGGGNTANMLAVWRVHGVDKILREAWESDILLCGSSAGSICWFEEGVTDSFRAELDRLDCLGFLPGSNCPHYDSEPNRRPRYGELLATGMRPGYAADDGVALRFEGAELAEVVAVRPDSKAYRVTSAREELIEPRSLPPGPPGT